MFSRQVRPYHTQFNRPFTTSHGTRTGTDIVILRLEWNGVIGYGEASIPPYRKTDPKVLTEVLRTTPLLHPSSGLNAIFDDLQTRLNNEHEALAAFDIALHDLFAQLKGIQVREMLDIPDGQIGKNMYTIATNDLNQLESRVAEAPDTDILKIKLTGVNDEEKLKSIHELTSKQLFLDVNQGWDTIADFHRLNKLLEKSRVVGLEQPFKTDDFDSPGELKEISTIPVFADESFETLEDLGSIASAFSGINIKLMKCGGIRNAMRIIGPARKLGLKVMLGSMSETTCGTAAAMQLAPLVDLLDQDGPWLLKNDPFEHVGGNGLGIRLKNELFD
jgi:L-alanine-DL-glutamate epimerase-like enolase superfamily enzyme